MANQEQLEILTQGVDIWNKWRKENRTTAVDLIKINFSNADLWGIDFNNISLINSNFDGADLRSADFRSAKLMHVYFRIAKLRSADFSGARLMNADLSWADLRGAKLSDADLRNADFRDADLSEADLSNSILDGARLNKTNVRKATLGNTILGSINLSRVVGLEEIEHRFPSFLGSATIQLSEGNIPEVFLRGCGLSDWEIESARLYNPNLSNEEINKTLYKMYDLRAQQSIQISPLFISYSHTDSEFVDKLEEYLNEKGVRFWRDTHDATAGRLEKQIDRAIQHNPTVLLVLSENSIASDWVQHEVRLARKLEKETGRDVLCPVALDESWKTSLWPERIMEQVKEYNILNFSKWDDDGNFNNMFGKLIDGLNLYYKK